ncbi:Hypp4538 [Branchiostoma lanceolatum]|uniref:Hypp4538 protein n=1 Tax=Branchiostoma lanceolatum TaxID=7740 RepID=A0A8K0F1D6_BRALA|nr:Hypp4538 [Branchiostoma lanceolatum]
MLRICEKLRDVDAKARRLGLVRTETDYLRALLDAMANMDRCVEVEVLKSLGDVNLEKGVLGNDVVKFNMALSLYTIARVRCEYQESGEAIDNRCNYAERLLRDTSSAEESQSREGTTPAKVAERFQDTDRKCAAGGNIDSVMIGYAQLMIEGMVSDSNLLEVEAIKSIGDVYLKRGTETRDTPCLIKATALYNTALERCTDFHGTVVIVHRLLHCSKLRQGIITSKSKRSACKQRSHHLSGEMDYISSSLSAVCLTSDAINDKNDSPQIFYRRYIVTADYGIKNGDLDEAETNLASALKLIQDPSKPRTAKEADCLYRLGDVYVERGKRTGEGRKFTQAAALYNASMARTDGDKQNVIAKLLETERQFLRNTCKMDREPCLYTASLSHKKKLDKMRAGAKAQLETIHQEYNPYQYDEDDPVVREVEIKRANAVKNLFKGITCQRRKFIQVLTGECIDALGPPPCKYAFIGLGSQATELVTPYSDLEFAILIEDGKDNDDTRRYFLNLTHYLHLKVINLGQTILPAIAIPSLNDFQSEDPEKDWFFDAVTPRGFAFDGFMPWASKTPFGRDKTKNKPRVSLIQTPAKLAEYQQLHIALSEGYHLSDILRRVAYVTGDEDLVSEYMDKVNKSLDRSPLTARLLAVLTLWIDAQENVSLKPKGQLLDVKKELHRFPIIAVDVMSFTSGVMIASVWQMMEELRNALRISEDDANHLNVLVSISAELRLRTYIANGGQKERLSPLV